MQVNLIPLIVLIKKNTFGLLIILGLVLSPVIFFTITFSMIQPTLAWNGTANKKVAAFYYQWFGNTTNYSSTSPYNVTDGANWWHWDFPDRDWYPPTNACSANTPVWGWYDSADPALMEMHLKQAEWAGIDAFVASYWGKNGLEFKHMKTLIEVARAINSNVSIAPYFEIFMGGMEQKNATAQIALLTDEFSSLYDFMTNPQYKDNVWYEDGKPVVWVYVVRAVSIEVWDVVISNLKLANKELFIVADRPHNNAAHIQLFQAQHQYDVYAPIRDGNYFQTFYDIKEKCQKANQIFIAGVAPGYNDTVVRDGNAPFDRKNGQYYEDRWNNALALNPDWISITSWNEWHEGTEIEPSVEHGDLALNQTRQFVQKFKSEYYSGLTLNLAIVYGHIWKTDLNYFISIYVAIGIVALLIYSRLK